MAPKRAPNNITPVQLAGAALGRTKRQNGLNAVEIAKVLAEAGIPPKRLRTDNEDLLIVNLTGVLERRGWSKEQVTTNIVERCGEIRNWDAWKNDILVMALHVEKEHRDNATETEPMTVCARCNSLFPIESCDGNPETNKKFCGSCWDSHRQQCKSLTQTTITGQKMKPATQGATPAQQQE